MASLLRVMFTPNVDVSSNPLSDLLNRMNKSNRIQTAELDWESIDGIEVPISKQFGDVYFSKDNGLLETRHVFLNGNDLSERLANLQDF